MNIINFIEQDTTKIKSEGKWLAILAGLVLLFSVILGYGMREDFVEAFEWFNLLPSIAMGIFVLLGFLILRTKRNQSRHLSSLFVLVIAVFLFISTLQRQTFVSLAKFINPSRFWIESLHCFLTGLVGGVVICLISNVFVFTVMPLPTKNFRRYLAILNGLAGVLLLSLHCPGPLISHIVIAHWSSAITIFLIQYVVSSAFFHWRLKPARK